MGTTRFCGLTGGTGGGAAKDKEHKAKLPGVRLPEKLHITSSLEEALAGKDVIVLAVPSVAVRSTARKMNPYIRYGQLIVNVAKGIEEHTLTTLTDMIEEEIPNSQACVLSGPATRRKSAGICYDLRGGGKKKRNCGISAEYLYESRVPRVYQRICWG